jgi:integrase
MNYLIKFCEEIGMNPDEIIKARIEDLRSFDPNIRCRFEDKVLAVCGKFKKENGYYIGRGLTVGMKSFFFHNRLPLILKSPKIKDPETHTPTKEDIEKLYRSANPGWERARISFSYQSGIRRGSIPFLTYGHVKKDFEAGIIPLHIHLKKEEVKGEYFPYDTFIGKQAVEDLRLSLELRKRGTRKIPPEVITDESPLFRQENTAVIQPCGETAFTSWFASLSKRAGFPEEETITPHSIRRATNTGLEKSKMMPLNWIDHVMGHRPRSAQGKHYSKPSLEELGEEYAKAEPYLTLRLVLSADLPTLKPENEPTSFLNKIERIETKPLERLTQQEATVLFEKGQQVQQSLSPYLNLFRDQAQSLSTQGSISGDNRGKTASAGKTNNSNLLSFLNAKVCPCTDNDESMPSKETSVSTKEVQICPRKRFGLEKYF